MYKRQDYNNAIQKLTNDVRPKMDGCGPTADSNDWIIHCGSQQLVRDAIDELIAILVDLAGSGP